MTTPEQAAPAAAQAAAATRRPTFLGVVARIGDRYGTLIAFVAMIVLFCILRPSTFATVDNLRSIGESAAPIVVLSVGLTIVMSTGQFDLSFPGVLGLASAGTVMLMTEGHEGPALAVVLGLAIGVCAGLIAGCLVASGRASSFIITLALSTIWSGLAVGISGARTTTNLPTSYINITFNTFLGIPNSIVIAAVVAVLAFALLRWSVFGRYAQALGSNTDAARLAGIRVSLTLVTAFVLFGLCTAITAIILSSSAGQFTPNIGSGLLITPFVAAFFGTSVLAARRFNVFGTVIGTLFIGTLQTGMVVLNIEPWVSEVILGAALIVILVALAKRAR
ncbi:MAG: transporter permease [Solirubrobacterales bacterium]|nr:transporter permease [Solirubrobacterales bacterium]